MSRKNTPIFISLLLLSVMVLSACVPQTDNIVANNDGKTSSGEISESPKQDQKSPEEKEVVEAVDAAVDNSEVEFAELKLLDSNKILAKHKDAMIKLTQETYKSDSAPNWEKDILWYYNFYDAGEIKAAPYKGQRLLVLDLACDGMCMMATIERFAWDEKTGQLTWLKGLSNEEFTPPHFDILKANTDEEFAVKALEMPKNIMLPDGRNALTLQQWGLDLNVKKDADSEHYNFVELGEVAFNDAKMGPVYFAKGLSGCLFVVSPDKVIASYAYDTGLFDERNWHSIKFKDAESSTYITSDYSPMVRGCGIGMSCYYLEEVKEDALVEMGKTDKGIKLYEAKNKNRLDFGENNKLLDQYSKTMPETVALNQTYNIYVSMYEYRSEEHKNDPLLTYDQFLAMHPVLYWKDPFGRFSAIIRNEVKPVAECGKPVIYLYPEKTSQVSVKVGIEEFTKTEPAYNDGWEVIAKPDGELTNLADGKKYPYLFWEGVTKKELAMNGGFVIEKSEVEKFLQDSLTQLGLNEQESFDFREFWVPKMEAAEGKYLLVSFVGTREFDKVAPLQIEPKPDTVIRVFMYYQPLAAPIEIQPQRLAAPARNGFTVVEWGGTSSDGWQTK